MSINGEVHPIQINILKTLLYQPEVKFSDLNPEKVSSDHFSFHIKKVLESGLVEKTNEGLYRLTAKGKEFANRFDTDSAKVVLERQAKLGVLVICVKEEGRERKYLVQQRLKQPYYGFHGFMTGKVKWGETVDETAARELEEETGLQGSLLLLGVKHKMDYSQTGDLLEDKFFFIYRVTNTTGTLVESFPGGKNMWLVKEEIKKLPDLYDGVDESIEVVDKGVLVFIEKKYIVSKY
jgi:8-oxo-dGTP pyrophosphatase MutT (NUDIX family)